MAEVLACSGVTLEQGQLPQPRTNGVALSQEIATALDLEIGDMFAWTKDDVAYASIVSPLEVVGILPGDVRLGCAAILLYLQQAVYAPVGLGLDFFNPTPWLYTLPVPAAVLAVNAGAVGWALSRLDPVAVIERR